MSAVTNARRRSKKGQWILAFAILIIAGFYLIAFRHFFVPRATPPDPSRTFRELAIILAEYREDGWECVVPPEDDGPYRFPVDCKGYSLIVGAQMRFKYGNEFGQIDVTVPGAVDRGYFIAPLETSKGRLTYIILEKQLPPDNPARQLAEKAIRERQ
jgi:hypothetical protein